MALKGVWQVTKLVFKKLGNISLYQCRLLKLGFSLHGNLAILAFGNLELDSTYSF